MRASARVARDDQVDGPDLVRRYLNEIGTIPLLTAVEEVDLAKRIEAGLYAAELLHQAETGTRNLDPRYRTDLAFAAGDGQWAKERMIRANLRLVVSVVKRHPHHALPLLDAIQEGNLGLIRAVEKFDYTKGYKFSTYATWWIRQFLARGTAQQFRAVQLPVHVVEELNKIECVQRELSTRLGHEPSSEELAAETGIPAPRIDELRRAGRDILSLDAPLEDGTQLRLGDLVTDPETAGVADIVARQSMIADVHAAVATLPAREALVINHRYGLDTGEPRTLREIGHELGLSSERVRQLERRGLALLRDTDRRDVLLPWAG